MTLALFEGFGIELEYMIVERDSLNVAPICDQLIKRVCGRVESEIELGDIAWSNELVLHVVEFKTNGPKANLAQLAKPFLESVHQATRELGELNARLLPTAMHPWMNPRVEMQLWPHDYSPVYEAYNRIFGCMGHGWANLQSMHINLPFQGDDEFGKLHAAIRLLLPILPALAASSPVFEAQRTGVLCNRMDVYRTNSSKIPSLTGRVIPEPVFTKAAYEHDIFARMYKDIAPFDTEGVLQEEFLNSRGAIARFDRDAIEIRVLDIQETPRADLAIALLVANILKAVINERFVSLAQTQSFSVAELESVLLRCINDGEQADITNANYLAALGLNKQRATAQELWRHLLENTQQSDVPGPIQQAQEHMVEQGPLARRILAKLGNDLDRQALHAVYQELASCLVEDCLF